uniref:W2 domain-containing protein n=1 Tax=Denticeps clupeoides TaxID=299321 RepID=A0AAY4AG58_9TELE
MFQQLMKKVSEFTIDTEERLKGVIDLIFEKAISEPNFSVAYANMCHCLMGMKVPTSDEPGVTVNFRKLLLIRCQKEFEKNKDDDEILEQKQKELDAAADEEEKQRLTDELEEAKDKAQQRSLGNIKLIGELFKLQMLAEPIMHDCIVKLLKKHDEESLECLCCLLSTIGKDMDFEKVKPRMDQYFNQMEKIIKERKTSSRICFMLQDVLDLRRNNWVPRRVVDQIHKEAEMEEHREQIKVQQKLMSKKDRPRPTRGGPHGTGSPGIQRGHPWSGRPWRSCASKGHSHKKTGALWAKAGFVTEQNVEFTLREESEQPTKKELSMEDLIKQLDKFIQDKSSNQRIHGWLEDNLNEHQMISSQFVRALMTSVRQSAIIYENQSKVNELQALYALQALMVRMEQPADLLRMFFDTLYDEDVIKEEAFYKWESSKDPAEQQGKSVTAFSPS